MTATLTDTSYDMATLDGNEVYTAINDGAIQLEAIAGDADAQVFLTPTEARHLALRLLAFAEQIEA